MINQTLNNRYKITERLGKGAMGTVYLATDSQSNREVALKIIAADLAIEPDMLERFKREGEALSKLKHPNIVEFLDAFEYEENYVIVMEYVAGGSLHDLIKKGAFSIEQANRIALGLCDALIRSHNLGIIHRDLKPENVLLAKDGTPKLADFGVARLNEGTRMTRSGTQVGTPYYMAPEAWEGKILDVQADIWSLGVVLFEMLTGKVPFGGDTGAAVMNKVLTATPPNLKTLRNEVPAGMVKIVSRMLTRDKKRRYQTMREIAVDLERSQLTETQNIRRPVPTRQQVFIGFGIVAITSVVWITMQFRITEFFSPADAIALSTGVTTPVISNSKLLPILDEPGEIYLGDLAPNLVSVGYGVFSVGFLEFNDAKNGVSYGDPIIVLGVHYEHGLQAHADSTIEYTIEKKYTKLETVIGKIDGACGTDGAIFRVIGDGKELYVSNIIITRYAENISVDITNVNELTLIVDSLTNIDCDFTIWGDPILTP